MVSIARSPSSAIAVVAEQRADGPFTQTVLGVTMVTDVVVVVLFTAAIELVRLGRGPRLGLGLGLALGLPLPPRPPPGGPRAISRIPIGPRAAHRLQQPRAAPANHYPAPAPAPSPTPHPYP